MIDRERAENVRRLAIREGVEALPQRLPSIAMKRDGASAVEALLIEGEVPQVLRSLM